MMGIDGYFEMARSTTKRIRNSFKFFIALQAKQIFKKNPDAA
jgi:hypothetical protein